MSILVIDNYDSFTYNIVQFIGKLTNQTIHTFRNDQITINEVASLSPEFIVISPGPGNPLNERDFGISSKIVKTYSKSIPTLGICLGHQGIGAMFGFDISQAKTIMHGKVSKIHHSGKHIFSDVPSPFIAARYHSLVVVDNSVSDELEVLAKSEDGEVMAIKHKEYPIFGVQFHPESILTQHGLKIFSNFLLQKIQVIQ